MRVARLAAILLVAALVLCCCGCPPKPNPSQPRNYSAQPEATTTLYVYYGDNLQNLRSMTVSNLDEAYNQEPNLSWLDTNGNYGGVKAPVVIWSFQPIPEYESSRPPAERPY